MKINVREYQAAIKNCQSIETGNIGYTSRRKTNIKAHIMQYVLIGIKAPESLCYFLMYINLTLNKDYLSLLGHHYTQTNK